MCRPACPLGEGGASSRGTCRSACAPSNVVCLCRRRTAAAVPPPSLALQHWAEALKLAEQLDPDAIAAICKEHGAMLEMTGEGTGEGGNRAEGGGDGEGRHPHRDPRPGPRGTTDAPGYTAGLRIREAGLAR